MMRYLSQHSHPVLWGILEKASLLVSCYTEACIHMDTDGAPSFVFAFFAALVGTQSGVRTEWARRSG
jgi:hypothetical protein